MSRPVCFLCVISHLSLALFSYTVDFSHRQKQYCEKVKELRVSFFGLFSFWIRTLELVSDCVYVFQDGCYTKRVDQLGEGGISRGQEKGHLLQLCHCLPWSQREDVQVSITPKTALFGFTQLKNVVIYVYCIFNNLSSPTSFRLKEIGSTVSGRKGADDSMTLQSQRFQIGDYLDIAITPPNRAPPLGTRMRPFWKYTCTNLHLLYFVLFSSSWDDFDSVFFRMWSVIKLSLFFQSLNSFFCVTVRWLLNLLN